MPNIKNDKYIFAFWEPKENIPPYLKLCMATWRKFLRDYKIILLDYSNIDKYLDNKLFDQKYLYSNFSLPKQADCIRCALLEKYGGIWFDLDTIITSNNIEKYLNIKSECIMVGWHIGFIVAKPHAQILKKWKSSLKKDLLKHKLCNHNILAKHIISLFDKNFIQNKNNWDFCGNRILNPLFKTYPSDKFYSIDKIKSNILPEVKRFSGDPRKAYENYYFNNDFSKETMLNTQGLIYLHNSWTPTKYKKMPIQEFLECKNTLSQIFQSILTQEEIMGCQEDKHD